MCACVHVHVHACAFAHVCVCISTYSLLASPSLRIILLTPFPPPRDLPAWPRVAGTTYLRSLKRTPVWSGNFWEGLDSAFSPAVWEPLAAFLQVTWPLGDPPPTQSPTPGLNSYT